MESINYIITLDHKHEKRAIFYPASVGRRCYCRQSFKTPLKGMRLLTFKSQKNAQKACDSTIEMTGDRNWRVSNMCTSCNSIDSMAWDRQDISINDKQGTWISLELCFCRECGEVHHCSV